MLVRFKNVIIPKQLGYWIIWYKETLQLGQEDAGLLKQRPKPFSKGKSKYKVEISDRKSSHWQYLYQTFFS